nr:MULTISPECIES: hypothetical protein [unclassified Mycolicibacterium]
MLSALSPRAVMAMAEGQPVVLKQFVQFCLIIVYPAWVVGMLVALAFYYAGYGVLWVLFAPIRLWMKKNRPDEYAASQLKN